MIYIVLASLVIAYAAVMGWLILRERERRKRDEQAWNSIQERQQHIMRGDRPILWQGNPSDEEKSRAITEFMEGRRDIQGWEARSTLTGETFEERASYRRRGELLSPGEHAMARAIAESLKKREQP